MYILFQLKVLREVLVRREYSKTSMCNNVDERKVAGRPRWQTRCQGSLNKLQDFNFAKTLLQFKPQDHRVEIRIYNCTNIDDTILPGKATKTSRSIVITFCAAESFCAILIIIGI